ncbi:MAG: S8 family serine peptidase [Candidatus Njordarchaeota archaeon]
MKYMKSILFMMILIGGSVFLYSLQLKDVAQYTDEPNLVRVLIFVKNNFDISKIREIRNKYAAKIKNLHSLESIDMLMNKYRREVYSTLKAVSENKIRMIKDFIENNGGKVLHELYSIGAISTYVPEKLIENMYNLLPIGTIVPEVKFRVMMDVASKTIYADAFWDNGYIGSGDIGDNKKGIEIAVVDTGIDTKCKYLSGRIIDAKSFVEGESIDDQHGHGTRVANIIVCNDTTYRGIAYGANVINAKAMNKNGDGTLSDVMAAIEWAVTQATDTAEIINLSLGAPKDESEGLIPDGNTVISRYIDWMSYVYDVLFVIAVGNVEGGYAGVNIPADSYNGIAVGALDDKNTPSRIGDDIWSGSCHGPTDDGRLKPDVVAPGVDIKTFSIGNVLTTGSGTSFATPMVSGSAALIYEYLVRNSNLSEGISLAVKATIINSADDWEAPGPDNYTGFGYINLQKAYDAIDYVDAFRIVDGNVIKYSVDLLAGEEFTMTITWWRTPSGTSGASYSSFYDIGKFRVEIYNSSGIVVKKVDSGVDNVMKVNFVAPEAGRYTIRIEKIHKDTAPLIDFIGLAASKALSRETGSLSISFELPYETYDNVTSVGKILLKNNANETITINNLNITSNKIVFSSSSVESIEPGESVEVSLNGTITSAGVAFIIVNAEYSIGTKSESETNGTVMIIYDDDDTPPTITDVDISISPVSTLNIIVKASDESGIGKVVFYWRLKYELSVDDLDLADGYLNLTYDHSSDTWRGSLALDISWRDQILYFVIIVYDADMDYPTDALSDYREGYISLGTITRWIIVVVLAIIIISIAAIKLVKYYLSKRALRKRGREK